MPRLASVLLFVTVLFVSVPAISAVSVTLQDDSAPFGFLKDENVLVIDAPSQFLIEGTFNNVANSQLNITQQGLDGVFQSYSFTESPIDFLTTAVFGPGIYLFEASAAALDNTSSFNVEISAVPLPAAAWMFGAAIFGFAMFSVKRNR